MPTLEEGQAISAWAQGGQGHRVALILGPYPGFLPRAPQSLKPGLADMLVKVMHPSLVFKRANLSSKGLKTPSAEIATAWLAQSSNWACHSLPYDRGSCIAFRPFFVVACPRMSVG